GRGVDLPSVPEREDEGFDRNAVPAGLARERLEREVGPGRNVDVADADVPARLRLGRLRPEPGDAFLVGDLDRAVPAAPPARDLSGLDALVEAGDGAGAPLRPPPLEEVADLALENPLRVLLRIRVGDALEGRGVLAVGEA